VFRFDADGYATLKGSISRFKAGEDKDLGTIAMHPGSRVRGKVVDSQGKAMAGSSVFLGLSRERRMGWLTKRSAFRPVFQRDFQTDAEGEFTLGIALLAGPWDLQLSLDKLSPEELDIPDNRRQFELLIRVRDLASTPKIEGKVVDEAGQPVVGASLDYDPRMSAMTHRFEIVTGTDGSFCILKNKQDSDAPVRLHVEKQGFDPLAPSQKFEWETKGHRLVMRYGASLAIQVSDANTLTPIEAYGIRILPVPQVAGKMSPKDRWVRSKGIHPEGILRLQGIARGRYRISIVADAEYITSEWVEISLPRETALPLAFRLHRAVSQDLRLVTPQGDPVEGSHVELLEPEQGMPISIYTTISDKSSISTGRDQATLWTKGRTGASGNLTLTGPPDRHLGLRIRGPRHVPTYIQGIRLRESGGVITVQVRMGATLIGRVHPAAILSQLERVGHSAQQETSPQNAPVQKPGLILGRTAVPSTHMDRRRKWFPITADGTFRISAIPPDDWTIQLVWTPSLPCYKSSTQIDLQRVLQLREGEERKIDIDISHLLMGEVHGGLRWNGKAMPDTGLYFRSVKTSLMHGELYPVWHKARSDAQGRFSKHLTPGVYECIVGLPFKGGDFAYTDMTTGTSVTVTSGVKQEIQLELRTAILQLRFKSLEGKALPGLRGILIPKGGSKHYPRPETNAAGECRQQVPAGLLRLLVLPKSLSSKDAMNQFRAQHGRDFKSAYEKALIPLQVLEVGPGSKAQHQEITVPKKAGY